MRTYCIKIGHRHSAGKWLYLRDGRHPELVDLLGLATRFGALADAYRWARGYPDSHIAEFHEGKFWRYLEPTRDDKIERARRLVRQEPDISQDPERLGVVCERLLREIVGPQLKHVPVEHSGPDERDQT